MIVRFNNYQIARKGSPNRAVIPACGRQVSAYRGGRGVSEESKAYLEQTLHIRDVVLVY